MAGRLRALLWFRLDQMTEVTSRPGPRSRSSSRGGSRSDARLPRQSAGPREPAAAGPRGPAAIAAWLRGETQRSLAGAAALAAAGAVLCGLAASGTVALAGWFLADAGAHGSTTDALGVGAQVWLLGHGAPLSVGGVPFGLVPLTVTAGVVWLLLRLAERAGRTARAVEDDRTLLQAAVVLAGVYLVLVVGVCVATGGGSSGASLPRAVAGGLLLSGLVGTVGLARGSGRWQVWRERVPGWVRAVAGAAVRAVAVVLAAAAVLLVVALGLGFNDALAVMAGLRLDTAGQVSYLVACALLLPNAVLLAAAYLLGPGFAVGAGTLVSPSVVALGPVPAFPLLAALPEDGATAPWLMGVMALPALAAAYAAGRAQLRYDVVAFDSAALRGFGGGAAGGVLLTALVALAGGPVGTGRLAEIGAPVAEVAIVAVGAMALAGMLAASAVAWWQRRSTARD